MIHNFILTIRFIIMHVYQCPEQKIFTDCCTFYFACSVFTRSFGEWLLIFFLTLQLVNSCLLWEKISSWVSKNASAKWTFSKFEKQCTHAFYVSASEILSNLNCVQLYFH